MASAETYKQEELMSLPQMAVAANWFKRFFIKKAHNECTKDSHYVLGIFKSVLSFITFSIEIHEIK